jgi:hypothetical protein
MTVALPLVDTLRPPASVVGHGARGGRAKDGGGGSEHQHVGQTDMAMRERVLVICSNFVRPSLED